MESYLTEFNRMVGVGPSLVETTAADPMLAVLAKAFSVKTVKPADVKYLRYRKVGHGVELEDVASKFGDILTSVEPKDADPKALLAFLKKHGAKPAPKVTESVYRVLGPGPEAGSDTDVAKFCADITKGVQSAVRGKFFRCVPNLKFGVGGANIDYANIPATAQPGSLDFLNAKVQVRLTVDGFDAEGNLKGSKVKVEKLTSPRGIKVRAKTGTTDQVVKHIVTTIKKAAAITESIEPLGEAAKSGFEVKVIHSKHNDEVVKVKVTGTFRGDLIHGTSAQIHLGLERMRHGWVTLDKYMRIHRGEHLGSKDVPQGFKEKILKAAVAKLTPLAHKIGNKEFNESREMTEKTKRDWYEDGRGMWRKEGTRFAAYVRDSGSHAEWNVSTVKGSHYSASGHAANVKAGMKAAEQGARKLAQEIKDERAHSKRVKSQPKRSRPMKGAAWESIDEAVSDLLSGKAHRSDVLVNPGSRKVGLAMFKDGVETSVQITKPVSWAEMEKHASAFKSVGLSFGWVFHRDGESLKAAGIRADVIKPYLTEVPKGITAKEASTKFYKPEFSVELQASDGTLWQIADTHRGVRFSEKGDHRKLRFNQVPKYLRFEKTGKEHRVVWP